MSNKTNDERLKILKARLTEIKQKKDPSYSSNNPKEEIIELANPSVEVAEKSNLSLSFNWIKYIVVIVGIGYGLFYAYNKVTSSALKSDNNNISPKLELLETPLKYNLDLNGDYIIITSTVDDQISAKKLKEDLILKGYKADYFYLPNKSNSTKEVYKVFIGPYENQEERNQWSKNLKSDFEIVKL